MDSKVILSLMQLKGVSRKTIINHIPVAPDLQCDIDSIFQCLVAAKEKYKKIKEYAKEDISKAIEDAELIIENCKKLDIRFLTYWDDEYPEMLKKCDDPPAVIYYKGDLSYINNLPAVAIVGTREPSQIGVSAAYRFGETFAEHGFVDVSGLAIGCDTEGHKGCLNKQGKTVAVLAGGLESVYPASNKTLADEIVNKGGALLSEYPPFANVFSGTFVERDRIQAALSCGVLVVETREQGGTLHAVNYALANDRLVGCFKHPEKYKDVEQSSGNKMLVAEGKADYIADSADIDAFCSNMIEKGRQIKCANNDIKEENSGEYVQLSLADFNWKM